MKYGNQPYPEHHRRGEGISILTDLDDLTRIYDA